MPIDKEKLARVKELAKLLDDSITREEIVESFKKILDFVKQLELKLLGRVDLSISSERQKIVSSFKKEIGTLNERVLKEDKGRIREFKAITQDLIDMVGSKLIEIDDRVATIRDGEQGEPGKPGKPGKDVDIGRIKQLETEIETLKGIIRRKGGGGTSAMGVAQAMKRILKTEQPTGDIDGANKTYTVTQTIFAVFAFSINGEVITQLPNYTIAGKTITFSTALPAAYSGKDFEIKYI